MLATLSSGFWTPNPVNNGDVQFYGRYADDLWQLSFSSANGSPLKVGAYENAKRTPVRGSSNALEFYFQGRACNQIVGRFDVLAVSSDNLGVISSLAVDFEQHCEGLPDALFGSLRINSSVLIRP